MKMMKKAEKVNLVLNSNQDHQHFFLFFFFFLFVGWVFVGFCFFVVSSFFHFMIFGSIKK